MPSGTAGLIRQVGDVMVATLPIPIPVRNPCARCSAANRRRNSTAAGRVGDGLVVERGPVAAVEDVDEHRVGLHDPRQRAETRDEPRRPVRQRLEQRGGLGSAGAR